jgi:hypothetical protein
MADDKSKTKGFEINDRIESMLRTSSWVLRVTEHRDKTPPVIIIKERVMTDTDISGKPVDVKKGRHLLKDRGALYGSSLRRCIPVLKGILSQVTDKEGIPLELHQIFFGNRISFRGNLPLDEEAGAKLALLIILQKRIADLNRVELIAWRVYRFSREEASYWLTRMTMYGKKANHWAISGMKLILGGQPSDDGVIEMLDKVRK